MNSEWVETTLGQVVSLQRGFDLPTQSRAAGAIPIMGSAGVTGYHNVATTKGPGVVVGRSGVGSMGVVSYCGQDFWALNTTLFVKDFLGNDPAFVYYLLSTINFRQFDTGSAQASLNRNAAYPHRVTIPRSLDEQKAIAGVLRSLEIREALLRETNATLEAIAQALFKSWFIDFGPVRAKQQGLAPTGMDEATAALFPDSFENSALGPIPTGWSASNVGRAFVLTMGQSPPGDTYNQGGSGLPFYQGRTDFGFRFPTQRVFCTTPTRLAEAGDALVSVRAPVGDVNMALERCCLGRGVAGIRHPYGFRSFAFYSALALRQKFDVFDKEGTVFGSITKKGLPSLADH